MLCARVLRLSLRLLVLLPSKVCSQSFTNFDSEPLEPKDLELTCVLLTVDIPLNIPKKTKLYVEQTQRERDHATEMHRHFQRDLCKLRLTTARAYVKIIKDGQVSKHV